MYFSRVFGLEGRREDRIRHLCWYRHLATLHVPTPLSTLLYILYIARYTQSHGSMKRVAHVLPPFPPMTISL